MKCNHESVTISGTFNISYPVQELKSTLVLKCIDCTLYFTDPFYPAYKFNWHEDISQYSKYEYNTYVPFPQ